VLYDEIDDGVKAISVGGRQPGPSGGLGLEGRQRLSALFRPPERVDFLVIASR
jgi:hypothetical protein